MRAPVVAVVVASVLVGCGGGGGGGDNDDAAPGESFVPPTTEEVEVDDDDVLDDDTTTTTPTYDEPAATLDEWAERFDPVLRPIIESVIDISDAVDADDPAVLVEHCQGIADAVAEARKIGPMPAPEDSDWTATLDLLDEAVAICLEAAPAGDDAAIQEALRKIEAAFVHLQAVTDATPG